VKVDIMNWEEKTVLVTGGTGSFGKKFTEIMLKKYHPKKLIIFSRDEFKQFQMKQEFENNKTLRFFIGDVRDKERLYRAFENVDIVVHAAAMKQIPICEYNPFEAVKTNIIGAENVINAAIDKEVEKVIAISSDKAVNPINLYGATKLAAEKMFIAGNSYVGKKKTRFSVVRYGNVLGSRGSVIPLFKEKKKEGVIPITDTRMTRFWITLDQGIEFVIRCFDLMRGGEIFIPKIPSMRIMDLVEAVAPGCKHEIIGIRPGEKLHEVLISEDESRNAVEFDDFFVIQPTFKWWSGESVKDGKKVPDGFKYSSDNNTEWLTVDQLRKLIK
jgi:UDP-N-acetylglucosamine 4,6-dehydratase